MFWDRTSDIPHHFFPIIGKFDEDFFQCLAPVAERGVLGDAALPITMESKGRARPPGEPLLIIKVERDLSKILDTSGRARLSPHGDPATANPLGDRVPPS